MTAADEKDALALLRALCEYAGVHQDYDYPLWIVPAGMARASLLHANRLDILSPPYCDTLLGAALRWLRKDGSYADVSVRPAPERIVCDVWRKGEPLIGGGWPPSHIGNDPEHAVLALGRAMRDAGVISTDAETKT